MLLRRGNARERLWSNDLIQMGHPSFEGLGEARRRLHDFSRLRYGPGVEVCESCMEEGKGEVLICEANMQACSVVALYL